MPAAERHPLAGRFIVLDGGEGCGKSTQLHRLHETLCSEVDICCVRDPGSTLIGERVRDLLLDPNSDMTMRAEMLLYMAARAQLVVETIRPALLDRKLVLCDRFISSTLAYQAGGDGLTATDIEQVGDVAVGGCWPDLTIILDVPTEVAQARVVPKYVPLFADADDAGDKDRIERRPAAYHRAVRQRFLELAQRHPQNHVVVDASQAVEQVTADVLDVVRRL